MPLSNKGPIKIGVTGGIGSGKSYICNIICSLGYPVYNCDQEAKRLMITNKQIINSLKQLIGENAYDADGNLNKRVIAQYLFANKDNAQNINNIVHPVVKSDFLSWAASQTEGVIFMESAILFESGFNNIVDKTISVIASTETRIERTIKRDNTTKEQVVSRMNQQMKDEERCRMADFIINNNETDNAELQITTIIETLETETAK